jgi:hypothetical protein
MPVSKEQMDAQIEQARMGNNPLPGGIQGLKVLRALEQCSVMSGAGDLNQQITQALSMEIDNPEEDSKLLQLISSAIAQTLRCETECAKNKHERTAAVFAEDDALNDTHKELLVAEKEVERLQEELGVAARKMQELSQKRWATVVKNFGLSPEKRMYTIDEEAGVVRQVDLKCHECKAAIEVKKAQEALMDVMFAAQAASKEAVEEVPDGPE